MMRTLLLTSPPLLLLQLLAILPPQATNAFQPFQTNDEVSMGTTILAVRYAGGIVVGADTRTSVSGYVSNRYAAKLTFVLDANVDDYVRYSDDGSKEDDEDGEKEDVQQQEQHQHSTCVICRSGSAADTQRLSSLLRTELVSRQILYGIRGTVTHVAALLRNVLVGNPNLSASLICAGYDHELGRGVIYAVNPGGTVVEEPMWASGGSGSSYILGYLDSTYPKDDAGDDCGGKQLLLQTEEEALEFVSNAIHLAMERDGSSGGFIRMYVIDKYGKRFVSKMPKEANNNNNHHRHREKEGMASSSSLLTTPPALKNFAPAATPTYGAKGLSASQ
eukprot:CAMPEP_0183720800 /NCGR_PEP_ID=MMETSP0737-20130205/13319_1 /TAXON_ID=385413 /ORGANISM="Thalassiosira miniscula, Strain CCMP1093" /LENGTH=332 /DNA_ID=CAMNT_0025950735 /DNA_START=21 /DNA_END=1019 /DNA_ORIENTATION=+